MSGVAQGHPPGREKGALPERHTLHELHQFARESVTIWIARVEAARDASLRTGLLSGHEESDLRGAADDLRSSWTNFDKATILLLKREGCDDLTMAMLVSMLGHYLQSIGAAGVIGKHVGLPTLSHRRMVDKVEAIILREKRGKGRRERLVVITTLISEALRKAASDNKRLRYDRLLTKVNAALDALGLPEIGVETLRRDVAHVRTIAKANELTD